MGSNTRQPIVSHDDSSTLMGEMETALKNTQVLHYPTLNVVQENNNEISQQVF